MRAAGFLIGVAALTATACSKAPEPIGVADTRGAETPDRDPYLAVDTMLVSHACSNCHAADYARVGPAMKDIAAAFAKPTPADFARLRTSVLQGSTGKWGDAIMPAQKQVRPEEVDAILRTILSAKPQG